MGGNSQQSGCGREGSVEEGEWLLWRWCCTWLGRFSGRSGACGCAARGAELDAIAHGSAAGTAEAHRGRGRRRKEERGRGGTKGEKEGRAK